MIELKGTGSTGAHLLTKAVVLIDVKVADEGFCVSLFWEFERVLRQLH